MSLPKHLSESSAQGSSLSLQQPHEHQDSKAENNEVKQFWFSLIMGMNVKLIIGYLTINYIKLNIGKKMG